MTKDSVHKWWFSLFGVKYANSATYKAVEEKLDQIFDAHEAELKAKNQEIAELKELTQKKNCYDCKDYLYDVCVDPRGCYCIWQQGMQDRHTPKVIIEEID